MATLSLTNSEILIGGLDFSSYSNKATLRASVAEHDVTTFGQTYHARIGGLRDTQVTVDGFWTSVPDAAQFAQLGTANQAVTICPQGTEGSIAYLVEAGQFTYDQFGKVGDAAPFSATVAGSDGKIGLVRGQLAALNRVVSATGQFGSILTMTSVGATQFLYATLHVLSVGTTITVIIESAPLIGFGAPTTRATIGPITTTGGTFMTRIAGPITDTFWRMNASVVTGSFTVSGAIAQQ